MTAYADIVQWAASRPWWQQQALVRLASGTPISGEGYEELADAVVKPDPATPSGGWLNGIQQPAEITSPAVSSEPSVTSAMSTVWRPERR